MNGSEREALALHLWDEGIVRPEDFGLQIIDAILADGYSIKREPREVTTVAELDALPSGSVVLSEVGGIWEQWRRNDWRETGSQMRHQSDDIALPATVVLDPEVTE